MMEDVHGKLNPGCHGNRIEEEEGVGCFHHQTGLKLK
jgi:hypothetical protein